MLMFKMKILRGEANYILKKNVVKYRNLLTRILCKTNKILISNDAGC